MIEFNFQSRLFHMISCWIHYRRKRWWIIMEEFRILLKYMQRNDYDARRGLYLVGQEKYNSLKRFTNHEWRDDDVTSVSPIWPFIRLVDGNDKWSWRVFRGHVYQLRTKWPRFWLLYYYVIRSAYLTLRFK